MKVAFRTDASLQIGTGHVMRCLTLADALRERAKAQCHFICRAHLGHLAEVIRTKGYSVTLLPTAEGQPAPLEDTVDGDCPQPAHARWLGVDWQTDSVQTLAALHAESIADWLIVDHYALDHRWERATRPLYRHLMVIDDLADRDHDCDLLLDQNLGKRASEYATRVPAHCRVLAGTRYALLRPEFARLRPQSLARRRRITTVKHLLVSFGGVDKDNATGAILAALRPGDLPADCAITVIMGRSAPWLPTVKEQAIQLPWATRVLVDVQNMAPLMAESDLAIGAAGTTSWERCCLGLPAIVVVLADNQRPGADALARANAVVVLRKCGDEQKASLTGTLDKAQSNLFDLAANASTLCDGDGAARIVTHFELRHAA